MEQSCSPASPQNVDHQIADGSAIGGGQISSEHLLTNRVQKNGSFAIRAPTLSPRDRRRQRWLWLAGHHCGGLAISVGELHGYAQRCGDLDFSAEPRSGRKPGAPTTRETQVCREAFGPLTSRTHRCAAADLACTALSTPLLP